MFDIKKYISSTNTLQICAYLFIVLYMSIKDLYRVYLARVKENGEMPFGLLNRMDVFYGYLSEACQELGPDKPPSGI